MRPHPRWRQSVGPPGCASSRQGSAIRPWGRYPSTALSGLPRRPVWLKRAGDRERPRRHRAWPGRRIRGGSGHRRRPPSGETKTDCARQRVRILASWIQDTECEPMSILAPGTNPRLVGHGDPLHLQVYDHIWTALMAGELPPGTRLKDGDWAQRLGVSRTPVREAFRKLVQDGALDPLESVGFSVHVFTAREVAGLYHCRGALERLVAEEAS